MPPLCSSAVQALLLFFPPSFSSLGALLSLCQLPGHSQPDTPSSAVLSICRKENAALREQMGRLEHEWKPLPLRSCNPSPGPCRAVNYPAAGAGAGLAYGGISCLSGRAAAVCRDPLHLGSPINLSQPQQGSSSRAIRTSQEMCPERIKARPHSIN